MRALLFGLTGSPTISATISATRFSFGLGFGLVVRDITAGVDWESGLADGSTSTSGEGSFARRLAPGRLFVPFFLGRGVSSSSLPFPLFALADILMTVAMVVLADEVPGALSVAVLVDGLSGGLSNGLPSTAAGKLLSTSSSLSVYRLLMCRLGFVLVLPALEGIDVGVGEGDGDSTTGT